MKSFPGYFTFIAVCFFLSLTFIGGGCAQIGTPTGGAKDTLAPKLIKASPAYGSRNVSSNKITLEFNEYIDVTDLTENLIISPVQNKTPTMIINNKSIVVKFRDSLLPNTTYTLNFGKAVKDINEGNVYDNLSYTFSTGPALDSLTLKGTVIQAETGSADSTMIVMLYRRGADSSVKKIKPNYITKTAGDGSFSFDHLPADSFRIYALKDEDGGKTYNALSERFAFAGNKVISGSPENISLYSYVQEQKAETEKRTTLAAAKADKKLRYTVVGQPVQDLLTPLEISFNNALKTADSNKIFITDTLYRKITGTKFSIDSTAKKISIDAKWVPETPLVLIIQKDAVKDSAGLSLTKTDTVKFTTKRLEDYGKVVLHFSNLDLSRHPVLEFLSGNDIKFAYPLSSSEWSNNLFTPGDYGIRILYDTDRNGKWTPGNYERKLQPELTVTLPQKLSIKADWDNEREINL